MQTHKANIGVVVAAPSLQVKSFMGTVLQNSSRHSSPMCK